MTDRTEQSGGFAEEARRLVATLKPAQRRVLTHLAEQGVEELTRAEYERIGLVSRSQAAYDLAELVQMGLLERIGSGRATQYRRAHPGAGRKRRWSDDRIRAELAAFCAGRPDWPRAHEFRTAGRGDLYLAACRYGGLEHWAAELGYRTAGGHAEARRSRHGRPPRPLRAFGRVSLRAAKPAVLAGFSLALGLAGALAITSDQSQRGAAREPPAPLLRPVSAWTPVAPTTAVVSRRAAGHGSVILTLHGARGSSSVTVRRGSARGPILFAGILTRGATARLRGARLWTRLGAPWNLDVRVGRQLMDMRTVRIGIVTLRGVRIVARAHRPPPVAPPPAVVGPTALAVSTRSAPASPPAPVAPAPAPPAPQPAAATAATPSPDPLPNASPGPAPGPDPKPRR